MVTSLSPNPIAEDMKASARMVYVWKMIPSVPGELGMVTGKSVTGTDEEYDGCRRTDS